MAEKYTRVNNKNIIFIQYLLILDLLNFFDNINHPILDQDLTGIILTRHNYFYLNIKESYFYPIHILVKTAYLSNKIINFGPILFFLRNFFKNFLEK